MTCEVAPQHLSKTAFMVALFDDNSIMLAVNQRRGTEIAGGHVEEGETLLEAALREATEEIGCEVETVVPLGYIRMESWGEKPEGWTYPHPVGYQQFFAGRIVRVLPFTEGEECAAPIQQTEPHHNPMVNAFWQEAVRVLQGEAK